MTTLLLAAMLLSVTAAAGQDPLVSASSGGLPVVDDALARLAVHRRLLMIAAHPDDEDTFLLTLVSRGQHGEAAYLSLTRGDGGQNLIGDELGPGLGLLRSRELEAARRIDGARQFFSRAYDFGYTRSLDETLQRWPRQILLEDAMRVVRRFRPQVLVAVFPPTAAAGHGQHQASAWVAERVYEMSRQDTDPFPQLTTEGIPPWSVSSLYRAAWFRPESASMQLPIGQLDAISGRSIFQTALLSRSQHRCQDMGFEQPPGDAVDAVTWLAGAGDPATHAGEDVFAGVDTRLSALAASLEDAAARHRAEAELADIAAVAVAARSRLSPVSLAGAAAPLTGIVRRLRALRRTIGDAGGEKTAGRRHVEVLLDEKLEVAQRGLAAAAGLVADAVTDRGTLGPGSTFDVRTLFWNAGDGEVADLDVRVETASGWTVAPGTAGEAGRGLFTATVSDERVFSVAVPPQAAPGVPYFLRTPRRGDLYSWSDAESHVLTRPFEPPPVVARFRFELDGVAMELQREVVHRRRDQALGEVRRPLRVVPALELSVDPPLLVWPMGRGESMTLVVRLWSNLDRRAGAELAVDMPEGWPAVARRQVELEAGGRASVRLEITPPARLVPGSNRIRVSAISEGRGHHRRLLEIDYPHIRPAILPVDAETRLEVVDLALPELRRVAYVRGASDRVPEMLAAVGVPIELLDADALEVADLLAYDAIVLGSRAYEVEPALAAANPRLLDYVRSGGLVIVQYQQYAFSSGAFAPLSLEIRRPHDRITDEAAAVRLLEPTHPVLARPNPLKEADWEGWVQERGLYFAGTWDAAWTPLLAMADPGGDEQLGGLLVAEIGDGHYVYTGLAFFRQLPAGVGGAYRLFANLLALAEQARAPAVNAVD